MEARYTNPDADPRGSWTSGDVSARNFYSEGSYAVTAPSGRIFDGPPPGRYWSVSQEKFKALDTDNRVWWGVERNNMPRLKRFLTDVKQGIVPQTLWFYEQVGHTQDAKRTLLEMGMLKGNETITPKPVPLIQRAIEIGAASDALILDSFAGSGTTAHAVLKANAKDDGTRRFILIEGENYADTLTAERVRRAINGYAWVGTQRETLLEEKITFSQFKKADDWLKKVEAIKTREGFGEPGSGDLADMGSVAADKRFDKITTKLEDGVLRVEGERRVSERAEGLGGEFTYCTLGEPIDLDKLLSGEQLPSFDALGAWLFYTATGGALPPIEKLANAPDSKSAPEWYLGEAADAHVWLIYRPQLAFLKSPDAALTLSRAQALQDWATVRADGKPHLVFAPAKYMSNKQLADFRVNYAPLPFALYRES